ncbi:MAG: metallophosphatase domain-containing protein [Bradymonadaceae bacterium]
MTTTIVVISDTHGRHRDVEVPDGDILVHAGDFTGAGRLSDVDEIDDWLGGLPHPTKLVVAGNCDRCCERDPDEVRERLTNAQYLQDDAVEIEGIQFWGSPWQPKFLNMSFNLSRGDVLAEKWELIPEETDVLITHGPPRGILDRTSRGEEVGDRELLARVTEIRPTYHFFGHVHESSGVEERGETTFVNAACDRAGKEPVVVEYPR